MVNKQRIREMLNFQDLSTEEKQRRGILGRLYGPCASITDATRNGRLYDDNLWENVFTKNDIVKEMFENGGIPMELDHPRDREDTDSSRIAAMLPEAPKRDKDGHLICYVDLIDTPCGKIAYQLAKYGFKLGISSRGSGDVREDDSVDPDTYDFTTFDLVLLPAVKDARLSMCESLDTKNLKLKQALTESYESLDNEKDKEIMKETLEKLDIDVDFENKEEIDEDIKEDGEVEFCPSDDAPIDEKLVEDKKEDDAELEEKPEDETEEVEDEGKEEEKEEDAEKVDSYTVKDLVKELKDYDKDLDVEFKPIVIDGVEYPVEMLGFDDSEDGKLVVSINYSQEIGDNIDEVEAEEPVEENAEEIEKAEEEVIDDESDEVFENLKEAIRQKDLLENEVKNLRSEKTVSDTEVKNLTEELNKYKAAFARTSKIAAECKKSEAEVEKLTEQLNQKDVLLKTKDTEIDTLKQVQVKKLNESVEGSTKKIKILTEQLVASQEEVEKVNKQLSEQANVYKQKLNERVEIAKKYKAKAELVLTEYINFRASMLGVRPAEITSKLDENYSIKSINEACDSILNNGMPNMPFNLSGSRNLITESKKIKTAEDKDYDDLLDFAGLK